MALGYCEDCKQLVTVTRRAQKWGSRECDWAPLEHEGPDGTRCTGAHKTVRDHREPVPAL